MRPIFHKEKGSLPKVILKKLDRTIEVYRNQPGPLIPVLQKAQEICGYLPQDAMDYIARSLRIPSVRVYGVATFYAQFSFKPRGKHTILSCQGTACHVRGGDKILEDIKKELGIQEGDTTEDGRFTLEKVYCIGCCSLSPAIIIDSTAYGKLTTQKVKDILASY
jgi:NADH:ubiquinone oxidoreductase subunit E